MRLVINKRMNDQVVPTSQSGSSPSSSNAPSHLSCRMLFHAACSPAPRPPPRRRGVSTTGLVAGGAGAMAGAGVSVTTLAASGCATARLLLLTPPWLVARRPGTAAPLAPAGRPAAPDIAANTQSDDEAIVGDIEIRALASLIYLGLQSL